MVTRAEHLAWAKQRALEYADRGEIANCIASMISDLGKHDETAPSQIAANLTADALLVGSRRPTREDLRRWVEGFQ